MRMPWRGIPPQGILMLSSANSSGSVTLLILFAAAAWAWIVASNLVCHHRAWSRGRNCCASIPMLAVTSALPA